MSNWILSGTTTVSVEAVDVDSGERRNVCFEVPASDFLFVSAVTQRWLTSFEERAWQDQQSKERKMPKSPKPLVSPFPPDKTFDPVDTFDWPGVTKPPYEPTIGPNGAAVVAFTVPAKLGTKIHINISYIGSTEYPTYVLNQSATALDFEGAQSSYQTKAADYMVVAAGDPNAGSHTPISQPGPTRGFIPLVAGAKMNFNIATLSATSASETRIQLTVS